MKVAGWAIIEADTCGIDPPVAFAEPVAVLQPAFGELGATIAAALAEGG